MLVGGDRESWRSMVWMSGSFTSGIPELRRPQGKGLRRARRPVEGTILSTESGTESSQSDSSSGASGSGGGGINCLLGSMRWVSG